MCEKYDKCSCSRERFDAEAAYLELARRQEELAELVIKYISGTGTKRSSQMSTEISEEIAARVIGGLPAPIGAFPDCCLVGEQDPSGEFRWYCTGVLVHPRIVLTAAHCIKVGSGQVPNVVALKTGSINDETIGNAEVIRMQGGPILHPLFSNFAKTNDIAVLVLKRPAVTRPVPIAFREETTSAQQVRVVGFGATNPAGTANFGTKRVVAIPIHFMRRGAENLDSQELTFGFESDIEFVAGGSGRDACMGDSGGPAYIETPGGTKVVGLVSRKVRNSVTECGSGGVYTRLDTQEQFIKSVINGL